MADYQEAVAAFIAQKAAQRPPPPPPPPPYKPDREAMGYLEAGQSAPDAAKPGDALRPETEQIVPWTPKHDAPKPSHRWQLTIAWIIIAALAAVAICSFLIFGGRSDDVNAPQYLGTATGANVVLQLNAN
jgi:hypothetical protein